MWLDNLGINLSDQYNQTENIDDLEAAISKSELAVSITPVDHWARAERLNNLGDRLAGQYNRTENIDDLEMAFSK